MDGDEGTSEMEPRAARRQTDRPSDRALARLAPHCLLVGAATTAALASGIIGDFADAGYAVLGIACFVVLAVGLHVHRPASLWTWRSLGLALVLFGVGAAARAGTVGDLTASRSIIPDVVTLGGYALLGTAFMGMIRARHRHRSDRIDALLDAVVAGLATLCVAWVHLIVPTLSVTEAPTSVRVALASYPMMSTFLVAVTARLVFGSGSGSGFSFRLLVGAMLALLVGDVAFLLAELGIVAVDAHLLGVPHALSQVGLAAAVVHPSMREMTNPLPAVDLGLARSRIVVIAAALAVPGIVTLAHPSLTTAHRLGLALIVAAVGGTAVTRMVRALQGHADARAHLAHQATHDELTGLANRSYLHAFLDDHVGTSHAEGRRVALLFLDLDRFKYVNDSLGHDLGDELLVRVAERLFDTVREEDLVARLGGDEFVVVLTGISDLDEVVSTAERVRLAFQVPLSTGTTEIVVSTSIGVVLSQSGHHTAVDLVRNAHTAMYQAKDAGRNTVAVFDRTMLDGAARRLLLDAELRGAIAGRQLHIDYQPLVVLPEGRVEGFEALMRWTHPTIGSISPAEFIPVAEDNGMIVELGAWILRESCRQIAWWRATLPGGENLHVSVNVSAPQLQVGGFTEVVAAALELWGLPGDALWLELTESLLIDDPSATGNVLDDLRALGVRLSVDDFGTGYSSLAYLKRFPVDRVKIDAGFVRGVGGGGSDDTLIAAIVAMAEALGLSTIAEGVETLEQAHDLFALHVGAAQGYLFARPLPARGVADALERLGTVGAGAGGADVDADADIARV